MANIDFTPIKTVYNGYLFKSKLEAKWAVFFDRIGIGYQYEPEAFAVEGGWYTPDFYLPDVYLRSNEESGVYIEVKPTQWRYNNTTKEYVEKITKAMSGATLILFNGEPYDFCDYGYRNDDGGYQLQPYYDNCMILVYCSHCNIMKVEFAEGNYMYCEACNGPRCVDTLLSASIQARQFHFKH